MIRLYAPKNCPTRVTDPPQPMMKTKENPATNKSACKNTFKRVLSKLIGGFAISVDIISPANFDVVIIWEFCHHPQGRMAASAIGKMAYDIPL